MKTYLMADPTRYARMTTAELRETFLVDHLFAPGEITMVYCDVDRTIVGSAVPTGGGKPLILGTADQLRAAFFLERRELGILNIGGKGSVSVDGKPYDMENLDCLYVGRGNKELAFTSADPATPAQFYLLSYPAHTTHPTTLAKKSQAAAVNLGTEATANKRTLYKYIHPAGIQSCQLVMGFTQLDTGSIWNTMPSHTHQRRSEVYLYFNIPADHRVFHFMGPADETRHLVVADKQVAISPSWSIHSGAGTTGYTFCWGMGGENQAFDDMDHLKIADLK
jgi:4-deoxy-L-threo-5-hexosulose-uronate ketol-isomerase